MENRKIYILMLLIVSSVMIIPLTVWGQPFGALGQQPEKEKQHAILSSENGRYVFGQVSDSSKDKFMLDTLTGRLWKISESGGIGLYLTPIPYRIDKGEYKPVPEAIIPEEGEIQDKE